MTNFERQYLQQKQSSVFHKLATKTEAKDGVIDLTPMLNQAHDDICMQLNYRELDRLSREFERELNAVKALRRELEQYKAKFSVEVEDEATKKIQEVLSGLDKLLK